MRALVRQEMLGRRSHLTDLQALFRCEITKQRSSCWSATWSDIKVRYRCFLQIHTAVRTNLPQPSILQVAFSFYPGSPAVVRIYRFQIFMNPAPILYLTECHHLPHEDIHAERYRKEGGFVGTRAYTARPVPRARPSIIAMKDIAPMATAGTMICFATCSSMK
jgi:hypothetical protein